MIDSANYNMDKYGGEQRLICAEVFRCIKWCIGSASITFAALRGATALMRRFRSSSRTHHITSPLLALLPPTGPRPTTLFSLFYLGIHGLVSFEVGSNVTYFFFLKKKYTYEDLVKLPLVEGRSVVSEALCPDYIKAYRSIQSKGFDWSRSNYKESQLISTFVLNCKRRQAYEEKLRLARRSMYVSLVQVSQAINHMNWKIM